MRFRATLASFLTVMLLSLALFALNCEITCDLASMANGCHGSGIPASGNQQMAGLPDMEKNASANPGDEFLVAASPVCHTHACAQQPAVFSEQKAVAAHVSLNAETVFVDPLQLASEPVTAEFSSRGPPYFPLATPVSFHTTLII